MGIGKLFSRRRKQNTDVTEKIKPSDSLLKEEEKISSEYRLAKDGAGTAADYCEQIVETGRQLEELKTEYQAVTSYLGDIQKIERLSEEGREAVNDAARKILTLTRERAKYQNRARRITDTQFKNIAKYEDIMPSELEKMLEKETYNSTIKNDMRYLEGEKGSLLYQKEEAIESQAYLRKLAIATSICVLLLFAVFTVIRSLYDTDVKIPFLLTIVMAMAAVVYIFANDRKNRRDLVLAERKLSRAIQLLNKVKIKYINNTNALDYAYQKYLVNSYAELTYMWEQYLKAKKEERYYVKNSEELEYYNKKLIELLKKSDISDPEVWIYQASAILDSKEMSGIKHRLNARRKKLRERIDYNNQLKMAGVEAMKRYVDKGRENREEVMQLAKKYGIEF